MLSAIERAIVVPKRFCGPPQSGNGGYTCGLLAQALPLTAAVECTIRKPIPIERSLRIETDSDRATLLDNREIVVEAVATDFEVSLPQPIPFSEAHANTETSPAFVNHPFPTCFVCGPERPDHDGLNIYPALASSQPGFANLYSATWIPSAEFADDRGGVRSEFLWAAMDCPTGFAAGFPYTGKLVTGRLAVNIQSQLRAGSHCVLQSWSLGEDGRKCHAAASLRTEEGVVIAIAKATWIRVA
jgi:hypothetical protein